MGIQWEKHPVFFGPSQLNLWSGFGALNAANNIPLKKEAHAAQSLKNG